MLSNTFLKKSSKHPKSPQKFCIPHQFTKSKCLPFRISSQLQVCSMCFDLELFHSWWEDDTQSFNRLVCKFIYVTKADDGRTCLIGSNIDGRNCERKALLFFSFALSRNVSPFLAIQRDITESSQFHKLKANISNTSDTQLSFNENDKQFFFLNYQTSSTWLHLLCPFFVSFSV